MALPQVLKLALPALDSTIQAIGPGKSSDATSSGARTRAASFYELFYPRARYLDEFEQTQGVKETTTVASVAPPGVPTWIIPGSWDGKILGPSIAARSEETKINVFPGQMTSLAALYKLARVEKVEFHFKFTNLGPSAIIGTADAPTATLQSLASGSVNHTIVSAPMSQWTNTFSGTGGATPQWLPGSIHSDSNAAQLAELPGSSIQTSSQDGNREIIHARRTFDNAAKQAGDPIRTVTWMESDAFGTTWTMPAAQPSDPVLGVIGTSALLDQTIISSTGLNDTQRNFWFRYNEHVHVKYHITFWEPKTPQVTFS